MHTPWYRSFDRSWYIDWGGTRKKLGKDPRYINEPPRTKPKDPPPCIVEAYERLLKEGQAAERTFDEARDKYLKYLKASDAHVKAVRLHLQWFADFTPEGERRRRIGAMRMDELKKHMLTGYLATKVWKPNTRRYSITRILACLNHCATEQFIVENPLKGYARPRVERRKKIVNRDQQRTLEDAATPAFRSFLQGLRMLGCRPGELRTALIQDFNEAKASITVRNKTRDLTGYEERTFYLSDETVSLVKEVIGERTSGEIFLTPRGLPWKMDHLEQTMRRLRDGLGIDKHVTLYTYRHRWISDSINVHGLHPALVAMQAGWTNLKELMKTYLHEDDSVMREAMNKTGENAMRKDSK